MKSKNRGFTIVELLIVIVVIAILAAISVVAYNGIQSRAENTKTLSAASAWAKSLQLYRTDKGVFPPVNSCLGKPDTYTDSYNGRCWAPDTSGWTVSGTFNSIMSDYMNNPSEPSNKNVHNETDQYRGAMYFHVSPTDVRMYVSLVGSIGANDCPSVSGLEPSFTNYGRSNGRTCLYRLPQ